MFAPISQHCTWRARRAHPGRLRVQCGLTTRVGRIASGSSFFDDLQSPRGDGFNVGGVRELGVGHDGCRVRGLTRTPSSFSTRSAWSAGVVKFRCLTDDDGAGTDDEDAIKSVRRGMALPFAVLVCDHQVDETVKEVGGIVRARSSLGMCTENGDVP